MTLGELLELNETNQYWCPTRVYDLDCNAIQYWKTSKVDYSKAKVVSFEVNEEFEELALIVTVDLGGLKQ